MCAEEVGFEPTDPCGSHDLQSCRFVRSRTPPRAARAQQHGGYRLWEAPVLRAAAGSYATGTCESSQGRKAAALSGYVRVPQPTWSPHQSSAAHGRNFLPVGCAQ